MILLPISVQKLLEQEILPVQTFMSNLHCSVRGQKKETPPAVFSKKSLQLQALQRQTLVMALLTQNTSHHLDEPS